MKTATPNASGVTASKNIQLNFGCSTGARGLGAAVAAGEFLDPACGVDELLLTREKRMAGGADADFNITLGRTCMVNRAARAVDVGFEILRMNVGFHVQKRRANLGAPARRRKG